MILDQRLSPGQALNEAELARILEVSRTPIREALHRLETAGYLTQTGHGYVVVELGNDDVINVYRVRAALEGLGAHDAAGVITRRALGELEDLFEDMEQAREDQDDARLSELNSQFHHAIAAASGNRYLEAMLDSIYDAFERFRATALLQPGRRDNAAEEHGALIDALRARNAGKAREVAEMHVQQALAARQKAMQRDVTTEATPAPTSEPHS